MSEIAGDVIRRAAAGDIEAFETIYRKYSGLVYGITLRFLRNEADAQEATQDVFLSVHRNLKKFRFESGLKTWLYRITVNTAVNFGKKKSRETGRMVRWDEQFDQEGTPAEVEGMMNAEERERIVADLLGRLNPDQRACVILRNIEGLSYQEIAETLKININTVRSRLRRARETLLNLKDALPDGRQEVNVHAV